MFTNSNLLSYEEGKALNKDVEICITYEKFEDNITTYFVDYFDDDSDWEEVYNHDLSELFDELYLAIEYIENNFQIPKTITKQIKLILKLRKTYMTTLS